MAESPEPVGSLKAQAAQRLLIVPVKYKHLALKRLSKTLSAFSGKHFADVTGFQQLAFYAIGYVSIYCDIALGFYRMPASLTAPERGQRQTRNGTRQKKSPARYLEPLLSKVIQRDASVLQH